MFIASNVPIIPADEHRALRLSSLHACTSTPAMHGTDCTRPHLPSLDGVTVKGVAVDDGHGVLHQCIRYGAEERFWGKVFHVRTSRRREATKRCSVLVSLHSLASVRCMNQGARAEHVRAPCALSPCTHATSLAYHRLHQRSNVACPPLGDVLERWGYCLK